MSTLGQIADSWLEHFFEGLISFFLIASFSLSLPPFINNFQKILLRSRNEQLFLDSGMSMPPEEGLVLSWQELVALVNLTRQLSSSIQFVKEARRHEVKMMLASISAASLV